mmetsp:Transcript_42959/g.67965  ORF Transcript_42959/g.67965 Transcript_42959/m.67965 type:complete len:81 (-) Transcript_42959:400-642(-)
MIIDKANASEILELHRMSGHRWRLVHVITALHRIAKYPRGVNFAEDAQVKSLLDQVSSSSTQCSAQQLANSAWACAKLSC